MNELDLHMEVLDPMDYALSNDFWYGFGIGAATGFAAVGVFLIIAT